MFYIYQKSQNDNETHNICNEVSNYEVQSRMIVCGHNSFYLDSIK